MTILLGNYYCADGGGQVPMVSSLPDRFMSFDGTSKTGCVSENPLLWLLGMAQYVPQYIQ